MEKAKYLAMEYGSVRNSACNVHKSQGTLPATKLHYHDFYQIYFLTKGQLLHHSADAVQSLYSGDCFILPPYFPHRIEKGERQTEFYSFSFRMEFLKDSLSDSSALWTLLDRLTKENTRLSIRLAGQELFEVEQLMRCSLRQFEQQLPGWEEALRGLLTAVLVIFSRGCAAQQRALTDREQLRACMQYIDDNLAGPLRLEQLLQTYHFSASSFYRAFRQQTGQSFRQYVAAARVDKACSLLAQGDLPLTQIAEQCGFADYAGFYRTFVQRTGVCPREYRQSKQKTA